MRPKRTDDHDDGYVALLNLARIDSHARMILMAPQIDWGIDDVGTQFLSIIPTRLVWPGLVWYAWSGLSHLDEYGYPCRRYASPFSDEWDRELRSASAREVL